MVTRILEIDNCTDCKWGDYDEECPGVYCSLLSRNIDVEEAEGTPTDCPLPSIYTVSVEDGDNDWITWEGGTCPVGLHTRVQVKLAGGNNSSGIRAGALDWNHHDDLSDIIKYKTL